MVINHEQAVNPRMILNQYAYLTIDQRLVSAGTTQKSSGAHVDGIQGAQI